MRPDPRLIAARFAKRTKKREDSPFGWSTSDLDDQGDAKPRRNYPKWPDLDPPLGYPGGPCHVIFRAVGSRLRPTSAQAIVENVSEGKDLSKSQEQALYDDKFDKTPTSTSFKTVALSPHAQYRMDLRGVTMPQVRSAVNALHQKISKEKQSKSSWFQGYEKDLRTGKSRKFKTGGIEIVYKAGRIHGELGILIVTVIASSGNKPGPVDPSKCKEFKNETKRTPIPTMLEKLFEGRTAQDIVIRYAASQLPMKTAPTPGVTTFVTYKSQKDLPNDTDREKEVVLPLPGSATPGGVGRDIGKFEFSTPGPGSDIKPRTLGIPGEQYGHPTLVENNTLSRRTMTASRPELVWDDQDFEGNPWALAKSVGVNILSNKDFRAGYTVDGEIVAALFDASDRDGYEFDIAVHPDWQRKGLGSKLMDTALDNYEENREAFGEEYTLNMDVISTVAARMLKRRGLVEVGREGGHILMTRLAKPYKRQWKPGKRQRKQRGKSRMKSRQYYRKNRSKIKRKQKVRRSKSSFKKNPARLRSNKLRRRQNRKRVGSMNPSPCPLCVTERFLEARYENPRQRGGEDGKQQRRQKRTDAREDAIYYRQNRNKIKRKNKMKYHRVCKHKPNCMKRREQYAEKPSFYERKAPKFASVLTVPDIAFVIGEGMVLGYVDSVSPMSGMVTFRLEGSNVSPLGSMQVPVFLRAAVLLSDEDVTAFFDLVDVEVGLEAYDDLDEDGMRTCAKWFGVDVDSEGFRTDCQELFGTSDLSELSPDQMDQVNDKLVLGILDSESAPRIESDDTPRSEEDAREHDQGISEAYSPDLFYGEVEADKT